MALLQTKEQSRLPRLENCQAKGVMFNTHIDYLCYDPNFLPGSISRVKKRKIFFLCLDLLVFLWSPSTKKAIMLVFQYSQSGCMETPQDGFRRGIRLLSPPACSNFASPTPDCMHRPHLLHHWFSCQSTCLPVALSLSNKDFIVCIVVYGCLRETEYYVCLCAGSAFQSGPS